PEESRFAQEVRSWLAANVETAPANVETAAAGEEPAAMVEWGRRWQAKLAGAGWVGIDWPAEYGGRGASPVQVAIFNSEYARSGAPQLVNRVGINLAGPTLLAHGTPEQCRRWLPGITTAEDIWCQLFSEPGAGSDLAGLQTRAVKDGDEWVINGQKVWTSGGQAADLGMLLARTNPDVPKHSGISYFAVDMHQAGAVEVRPLREMTGRALFNEVFLTDARVADDACIGGINSGWAVANTTLAFERAGLGAGGGNAAGGAATPGSVVGNLTKRAGDFVSRRDRSGSTGMFANAERLLTELAKGNGKIGDPTVRQELMELHTLNEIARFTNLRSKAMKASGAPDIPGVGNIAKLSMSRILRLSRDLGLRILGPLGTLHAYTTEDRKVLDGATGNPFAVILTEMALFSPGPSIYGGTDEIQHNIIGERVLGLPKEPNNDKTTPFKDLPKNG
ncbi:MAG: acyl-CoA dehydrogenase family protein, partial [Acidimicrobiia bacterium]|nr:acyl-CoA dehydrogenase family protein [Acidimicrobiia bacterium]